MPGPQAGNVNRFDSGSPSELQFGVMLADQNQVSRSSGEHACDQLAKLAVTDYGDSIRWSDLHLGKNFKCCCQRFSEDRLPVADSIRHCEKVAWRQVEELRKRAVPAVYSENCAAMAVA